MEYNAKNVEIRTKELRKEFGSSRKLAEAAGCPVSKVIHYCSPAYLKTHLPFKETWEKYFGKWDQDTNPIPKEEISEEKPEAGATVIMIEEKPEKPEVVKKEKARIIIEVPSLEELEETLNKFGFRLEFVPR